MIRADLDCVFGKSWKCPSSSQRSSFQSPPSRMSLQSTSTSPFAVRVRSSLEPHFDPFTSCSFWSARPPCPNPAHGTRISRSAPACLRRDGSQHPWCPSWTSGDAAGCCSCARGPISVGWCYSSPSRWLVLARDELSRDELSTSDNDQGVFEQLHLMNFLLVHTSTGPLALFRACCLSLCV